MKRYKSIILLISIIGFSLILSSFSKNQLKSVKGYVHVYGNEPFTYLGIETSDNKEYAISADDETLLELQKSQGNLIEINGYIETEKKELPPIGILKDGRIVVTEWKYIK